MSSINKKITCIALSAMMLVSMCACTQKQPEATETAPPVVEVTTETTVVEETIPEADVIGSTENTERPEYSNLLSKLVSEKLENASNVKEVLTYIADSGALPFECMVEDIPEDYMIGFTARTEKFNDGAYLAPIIGAQPFIVYLFQTDNTRDLETELRANADLRWNICTQASEIVCEEFGEYLLFAMVP